VAQEYKPKVEKILYPKAEEAQKAYDEFVRKYVGEGPFTREQFDELMKLMEDEESRRILMKLFEDELGKRKSS